MPPSRRAARLSSRRPAGLPPPGRLHPLCRALAALDAILWPDEDDRSFLYTARWGRSASVLEWRNGEGDFVFVWFPSRGGAVIRGFAHESAASPFHGGVAPGPPGSARPSPRTASSPRGGPATGGTGRADPSLWANLPRAFRPAAREPGFGGDELTFALWWDPDGERSWIAGGGGRDDDGSGELLALFDGAPATYARDAGERLERRVSVEAVKAIFDGKPVTDALLQKLDPDADRPVVRAALVELGWPVALDEQKPSKSKAKPRRAPSLLEAAFTIGRDDDRTLLVIGDRVYAEGPAGLYDRLLAEARRRFAKSG